MSIKKFEKHVECIKKHMEKAKGIKNNTIRRLYYKMIFRYAYRKCESVCDYECVHEVLKYDLGYGHAGV